MADEFVFSLDEASDVNGGVLPFRLLVLGSFLPNLSDDDYLESNPVSISRRSYRHVLAAQKISVQLILEDDHFANRLLALLGQLTFSWSIDSIQDFEPKSIAEKESSIAFAVNLLARMIASVDAEDGSNELVFDEKELALLQLEKIPSDIDEISFLVVSLRNSINKIINGLLHHKELKRIEAAWRGLKWLTEVADEHPLCEICFLTADKRLIQEDIKSSASLDETHFYEIVYSQAYGQYGGKPYAAIVTDFDFDQRAPDLALLKDLAKLCSMSHAPLISSVNPEFFGVEEYGDISNIVSLEETLSSVAYERWRVFQKETYSAYVMLTLPRLLLRGKYQYVNEDQVYSENYNEGIEDCLWGSAAFAFAANCLDSFKRYQLCTELSGEDGIVKGLTSPSVEGSAVNIPPVEVLLSENKESELIRLGFTPLSVNKCSNEMLFYSANSVRWGYCNHYGNDTDDSMNVLLEAQFSYLFVILRVAHFLKVLSRSFVGSLNSVPELESALNQWLRNYVSDVENPSASVRAKRPLRQVMLKLRDSDNQSGWYKASLELTPHILHMGKNFQLSLAFDVASPQSGE